MSKWQKELQLMRENPKNARFADLDGLLLGLGFEKRMRGTSHAVYKYGKHKINIPFKTPFVGQIYVKQALFVIDLVIEE